MHREPRVSVAACDRSERWIIAAGIGAVRRIELSNRSSTDVPCRIRVEEPPCAAASPSRVVVPGQGSRIVDIVIAKTWDPASQRRLRLVVEGEGADARTTFTQGLVPAESAEFDLELELRSWHPDEQAGSMVVRLALWCVVRAVGSVPVKVQVDFHPHPSLRFPQPVSVALGCGETTGFEVPVTWQRAKRDERGWNHPPSIEVVATADGQRKTASVAWKHIEASLTGLLTSDDRQPRLVPAYPLGSRTSASAGSASQAAFRDPREESRLQQAVVTSHARVPATRPRNPAGRFRAPRWASLTLGGLAASAVALGIFFFLRPGTRPILSGPFTVAPLAFSPAPAPATALRRAAAATTGARPQPTLRPERMASRVGVSEAERRHVTLGGSRIHPAATTSTARTSPPTPGGPPVVALFGVEARYVPPQHALSVRWVDAAQVHALVQVLDARSRVIASRSVSGATSMTFIVLPRGYRGQVAVEVTAFGRHGERVVQTASLSVGMLSSHDVETPGGPSQGAGRFLTVGRTAGSVAAILSALPTLRSG